MNLKITNSPIYVCVLSRICAFTVLVVAFWAARFALHRLPVFALLGLTGFKYASMFYVAGRLIEQMWCYVSKVAARGLRGAGRSETASSTKLDRDLTANSSQLKTKSQSRQPHKNSLRNQIRQLRQGHIINAKDSEVSHG